MTPLLAALSLVQISAGDWLTLVFAIVWLIILEGLLSGDNALVLAVLVRHLPKHQQKRALRYGIIGAFVFRLIAILLSSLLLKFWMFELIGGGYLIYLAAKHFLAGGDDDNPESIKAKQAGFWATVVSVELADIAFSIDSILAAVALSRGLPVHLQDVPVGPFEMWVWIVFIGGVLGIITMRFVAGVFIQVLEWRPALASCAYWLVAWVGLKLVGGGIHRALTHPPDWPLWNEELKPVIDGLDKNTINGFFLHIAPDWLHKIPFEMPPLFFWSGMVTIVVVGLLYQPKPKSSPPGETPQSESDSQAASA